MVSVGVSEGGRICTCARRTTAVVEGCIGYNSLYPSVYGQHVGVAWGKGGGGGAPQMKPRADGGVTERPEKKGCHIHNICTYFCT